MGNGILFMLVLQLLTLSPGANSNLTRKKVEYGQYSGITRVSYGRYAIVHDKKNGGGLLYMDFQVSLDNGKVTEVSVTELDGTSEIPVCRDPEDVVYVPSSNTFFVCAEGDQKILEYDVSGWPTGRELLIPGDMGLDRIAPNQGFEALAYDEKNGLFWTTTEYSLLSDRDACRDGRNLLILQSFSAKSLVPAGRITYFMDAPEADAAKAISYVHGVPAMVALPDGRLVVMERELYVPKTYLGGWCRVKLYLVDTIALDGEKKLLTSFRTKLSIGLRLANYEGMCLGPVLKDGSRTILLISDSQEGAGKGRLHLSDWLKVIKID
ncbi:MAG: esterase-like activity of phytase family protein [Bacteroidales bacterium]|nr:esterase-like activity of phytase family protein [Bacteroidales bacterium]